jgi:hypothetical protein
MVRAVARARVRLVRCATTHRRGGSERVPEPANLCVPTADYEPPLMPVRMYSGRPVFAVASARSAAGVKVVSPLRMGDGPWSVDTDRLSHFAQVVVQLMIPPGQLAHLRLRDRQRIQVGMRRRSGLVLESVEHVHPHT